MSISTSTTPVLLLLFSQQSSLDVQYLLAGRMNVPSTPMVPCLRARTDRPPLGRTLDRAECVCREPTTRMESWRNDGAETPASLKEHSITSRRRRRRRKRAAGKDKTRRKQRDEDSCDAEAIRLIQCRPRSQGATAEEWSMMRRKPPISKNETRGAGEEREILAPALPR
jgi:hypothetical protein